MNVKIKFTDTSKVVEFGAGEILVPKSLATSYVDRGIAILSNQEKKYRNKQRNMLDKVSFISKEKIPEEIEYVGRMNGFESEHNNRDSDFLIISSDSLDDSLVWDLIQNQKSFVLRLNTPLDSYSKKVAYLSPVVFYKDNKYRIKKAINEGDVYEFWRLIGETYERSRRSNHNNL